MIKRRVNVFRLVAGRIEYTDVIKAAVLDPKITFKNLHANGGWDWLDQKYGFLQLLLKRGQIMAVETHSDLLACSEYLAAAKFGLRHSYGISIHFTSKPLTKKCAAASEKRMDAARTRWAAFCAGGAA